MLQCARHEPWVMSSVQPRRSQSCGCVPMLQVLLVTVLQLRIEAERCIGRDGEL